jgi:hypothetical protein
MKHSEVHPDMNKIVGSCDILFLCLDTLRYDVAVLEEAASRTPVLNAYGSWEKRQTCGNFTYPAHLAFFAGFLPYSSDIRKMSDRETLFFARNIGEGRKAPPYAYLFEERTWVEALAQAGYETICIGGVSFFDKRSAIGSVLPGYFQHSYWEPGFSCRVRESTKRQIDFALKKCSSYPKEQRLFLYINIDAVHDPNYFYLEGAKKDSIQSHAAALRYVDGCLEILFDGLKKRGPVFVICCSDHGTCYGEDGFEKHGIQHPAVTTVPYKHFFL